MSAWKVAADVAENISNTFCSSYGDLQIFFVFNRQIKETDKSSKIKWSLNKLVEQNSAFSMKEVNGLNLMFGKNLNKRECI